MTQLEKKTPLSQYDYHLPEELIAQEPIEPRDRARMMVLHRQSGEIRHHYFYELPDILPKDTLIVRNNTKVFPARLLAKKPSGGKVEILLLHEEGPRQWWALVRGRRLRPPLTLTLEPNGPEVEVVRRKERFFLLQFPEKLSFWELLHSYGHTPLPPYIRRGDRPEDRERYQTIYAQKIGAYAAPTAGLHFTEEVLQRLEEKGMAFADVTLHVGLGTFEPVRTEFVEDHKMHREYFEIPQATLELYHNYRQKSKPILAVGTTTVRTLETYLLTGQSSGWTDLFIHPPYRIRSVDCLLTNFHLPKSTLLMLISSFADWELIRKAYRIAVEEKYRFFSYGDCMLIL